MDKEGELGASLLLPAVCLLPATSLWSQGQTTNVVPKHEVRCQEMIPGLSGNSHRKKKPQSLLPAPHPGLSHRKTRQDRSSQAFAWPDRLVRMGKLRASDAAESWTGVNVVTSCCTPAAKGQVVRSM